MAANLPPESATMRATNPDWRWGVPEQLQALIADLLAVANWQRGSGKPRDYPEPIPRPGISPSKETTRIGGRGGSLSADEMREWLGWGDETTEQG